MKSERVWVLGSGCWLISCQHLTPNTFLSLHPSSLSVARLFRRLAEPLGVTLDVVAEFDDAEKVAAGLRRFLRVYCSGVLEHLVAGKAEDRVAKFDERALQSVCVVLDRLLLRVLLRVGILCV